MAHVPDNGIAENLFRRDGRLNRWRFFKRCFLLGLVEFLIVFVIFLVTTNALGQISTMGSILIKVVSLVVLLPYFCLSIRRLHDMNKNETLAYVCVGLSIISTFMIDKDFFVSEPSNFENIITVVNGFVGLYILLCPGTHGDNQYGSDTLE